jgi:hypothetical protein
MLHEDLTMALQRVNFVDASPQNQWAKWDRQPSVLFSAAAEYVSRPINIKDRRERTNEFIQYRIVLLF